MITHDNIMILERRLAICRSCPAHIRDCNQEQCADMLDGVLDVDYEKESERLRDAIKRGICPRGKFDAVNMEARV